MPDRKIGLTITAKDEASKTLDDVADALDDIGEGAEDAARSVVAKLNDAADQLEKELDDAERSADALSRALGPELSQRVDLGKVVTELRNVGLTADDVEANADELATALRRLDGIKMKAVRSGLGELETSASKTRNIMGGMVGDAVRDLPGVAGALGPVNMAAGQLVDNLVTGDVKLRSIISSVGPLAGVAGVVAGITYGLNEMSKNEAFRREQVDGWSEAVRSGGSALDALVAKLDETGKLIGRGLFSANADVLEVTAAAGVSLSQYSQLLESGQAGIDRWAQSLKEQGAFTDAAGRLYLLLGQAVKDYEAGARAAEATERALTEARAELARETLALNVEQRAIEQQQAGLNVLFGESAVKANAAAAAYRRMREEMERLGSVPVPRNPGSHIVEQIRRYERTAGTAWRS